MIWEYINKLLKHDNLVMCDGCYNSLTKKGTLCKKCDKLDKEYYNKNKRLLKINEM